MFGCFDRSFVFVFHWISSHFLPLLCRLSTKERQKKSLFLVIFVVCHRKKGDFESHWAHHSRIFGPTQFFYAVTFSFLNEIFNEINRTSVITIQIWFNSNARFFFKMFIYFPRNKNALREPDFSFLWNWRKFDRADHSLLVRTKRNSVVVQNQKELIGEIIVLSSWKETKI